MADHKGLLVWQRAHALVLGVYDVTKALPADEKFALTDQLRRAALSVPTNIVEGQAVGSPRVFARHLAIAHGSLPETRYLLQVAHELTYLAADHYCSLEAMAEETSRLLTGLRRSLSAVD